MLLKEGMKGTEVAHRQNFLKSQGFTSGVDGHFGKVTTAITKEFQKEHGLKADGMKFKGHGSPKRRAMHYDKRLALYKKCLSALPKKIFD